jgi:hypothetical protein
MADPVPHFMTKPLLIIGPSATPVMELECAANNIDASADQDENDYNTYCGTYSSYGPEKWTITATILQSFGVDGVWTKLRPVVGTIQAFELRPDANDPRSIDNPAMTGNALVKAFPFLSGGVNEPSEIDIVLKVQGVPTMALTGGTPLRATTATAGTPGAFTPAGAAVPNNLADLAATTPSAITASPATVWTTGQYVHLQDGSDAFWTGTAWSAGRKP